jgi:hypothetical protein
MSAGSALQWLAGDGKDKPLPFVLLQQRSDLGRFNAAAWLCGHLMTFAFEALKK